jgi:hypothetical protein
MQRRICFVALGLLLAGGSLVRAEVVKGVMAINGAEMP